MVYNYKVNIREEYLNTKFFLKKSSIYFFRYCAGQSFFTWCPVYPDIYKLNVYSFEANSYKHSVFPNVFYANTHLYILKRYKFSLFTNTSKSDTYIFVINT